jgi:hypothetical protein
VYPRRGPDGDEKQEGFELEIQVEELESEIAPDSGETVLPLPLPKKPR